MTEYIMIALAALAGRYMSVSWQEVIFVCVAGYWGLQQIKAVSEGGDRK